VLSSYCQSDTDFIFILLQSKYFGLELGIELSFLLLLCAPLLLPLLCSCCDDDVLVEVVSFSCCGFCHCVFLVL
jgi:hypothetical protein